MIAALSNNEEAAYIHEARHWDMKGGSVLEVELWGLDHDELLHIFLCSTFVNFREANLRECPERDQMELVQRQIWGWRVRHSSDPGVKDYSETLRCEYDREWKDDHDSAHRCSYGTWEHCRPWCCIATERDSRNFRGTLITLIVWF